MRNITVKSTQGKKKGTFQSDATTFGQIKEELVANGFAYSSSLQVIVQSTQSELLTDESTVPAGDQVLFMMPKETKSGWYPAGFSEEDEESNVENHSEIAELIERKRVLTDELAEVTEELDNAFLATLAAAPNDELDADFAALRRKMGR